MVQEDLTAEVAVQMKEVESSRVLEIEVASQESHTVPNVPPIGVPLGRQALGVIVRTGRLR